MHISSHDEFSSSNQSDPWFYKNEDIVDNLPTLTATTYHYPAPQLLEDNESGNSPFEFNISASSRQGINSDDVSLPPLSQNNSLEIHQHNISPAHSSFLSFQESSHEMFHEGVLMRDSSSDEIFRSPLESDDNSINQISDIPSQSIPEPPPEQSASINNQCKGRQQMLPQQDPSSSFKLQESLSKKHGRSEQNSSNADSCQETKRFKNCWKHFYNNFYRFLKQKNEVYGHLVAGKAKELEDLLKDLKKKNEPNSQKNLEKRIKYKDGELVGQLVRFYYQRIYTGEIQESAEIKDKQKYIDFNKHLAKKCTWLIQ